MITHTEEKTNIGEKEEEINDDFKSFSSHTQCQPINE